MAEALMTENPAAEDRLVAHLTKANLLGGQPAAEKRVRPALVAADLLAAAT